MRDFTTLTYAKLIEVLQNRSIKFATISRYFIQHPKSSILLRHDVDRLPENSLKIAEIENKFNIKGTYYFRIVPKSFDIKIIEAISKLGHEIGYHYEDVDLAVKENKKYKRPNLNVDDLIDKAYESYINNLNKLRKIVDVKTICMHGSPMQKYNNKLIWTKYDYREHGILGEPYYDIDYSKVAYFTDTGRRWNGEEVSLRDKVQSDYKFNFKTTFDLIKSVEQLPNNTLFTIHPERWSDEFLPWTKQLVLQNIKNPIKKILIQSRKNNDT